MSAPNLDVYIPVVIMMVTGALLVIGALLVGRLIRPQNPTALKLSPYECGEAPVGSAWSSFNIRFYVVGLIFIIFDVESALMFPVVAVFKKFNEIGLGGLVLVEIIIFLLVLVAGIAYCWRKGDLDWVRSFQVTEPNTSTQKASDE
jgi:NADH-quinone oxidoreductase subunit A